jgi:hypothetical protein
MKPPPADRAAGKTVMAKRRTGRHAALRGNHRDPNGTTIRERWNGVTARPGVQAALQKVDRVEAFAIAQGLR